MQTQPPGNLLCRGVGHFAETVDCYIYPNVELTGFIRLSLKLNSIHPKRLSINSAGRESAKVDAASHAALLTERRAHGTTVCHEGLNAK